MELHQDQIAHDRFRQLGVLPQRERYVLEYRQVGEQRAKLEQHAHSSAHRVQIGVGQGVHGLAGNRDPTARRLDLAADEAKDRGLAAAAATHDRHHLPLGKAHVDALQNRPGGIGELDVREFHERGGSHWVPDG
jgi:hypothetical protein